MNLKKIWKTKGVTKSDRERQRERKGEMEREVKGERGRAEGRNTMGREGTIMIYILSLSISLLLLL